MASEILVHKKAKLRTRATGELTVAKPESKARTDLRVAFPKKAKLREPESKARTDRRIAFPKKAKLR